MPKKNGITPTRWEKRRERMSNDWRQAWGKYTEQDCNDYDRRISRKERQRRKKIKAIARASRRYNRRRAA